MVNSSIWRRYEAPLAQVCFFPTLARICGVGMCVAYLCGLHNKLHRKILEPYLRVAQITHLAQVCNLPPRVTLARICGLAYVRGVSVPPIKKLPRYSEKEFAVLIVK